jgi:CBS domain-containing protein
VSRSVWGKAKTPGPTIRYNDYQLFLRQLFAFPPFVRSLRVHNAGREMTRTVEDLLRKKDGSVLTVDENATVYEAIEIMEAKQVGSIIVTSAGATVGIFTERDYLRRIVLQGRTSRTTLTSEAMTTELITVEPSSSIPDCMALMTEHHIRHLPVTREGQLVGILSIGDIVKALLVETQAKAQHLEDLISGSYPG